MANLNFLLGFDSNDELVFMARHLGDQYDNVGAYPPDILPVTKSNYLIYQSINHLLIF